MEAGTGAFMALVQAESDRQDAETEDPCAHFVGRRVSRVFDGEQYSGTVSEWRSGVPSTDQAPLWHVVHDDGDEEDLALTELRDAMALHDAGRGGGSNPTPQPTQWRSEGHAWLGVRGLRGFASGTVGGVITGWVEGEGASQPPLWHMVHDDGDAEDLDEEETRAAIAAAAATTGSPSPGA